jgi:hemoglobin
MSDESPSPTPYELIGGDAAVRSLVDRFYDLMELDPRFTQLRALHPERLDGSRDKLYMFLSGWLGGPALYVERHGHPMLRARHLPFPIASTERDQWLACMRQALDDTRVREDLKEPLMQAFFGTADWMRNRKD